jgi:hypothetical protein
MILNTLLYGILAAIMCIFLLSIAWKAAHENENLVAVLFAMTGAVSGLLSFTWIIEGL